MEGGCFGISPLVFFDRANDGIRFMNIPFWRVSQKLHSLTNKQPHGRREISSDPDNSIDIFTFFGETQRPSEGAGFMGEIYHYWPIEVGSKFFSIEQNQKRVTQDRLLASSGANWDVVGIERKLPHFA